MFDEPVVYVDIETSGGSYKTSQIIEVAAIRVEKNLIVDEFRSLVNPGTYIPQWITQLTGLTQNDLVQAPSFEDIAYQLNQILDGAIFAAHNVRFDYSFIKRQLEEVGYRYNPKLFCTVRLSRALYSDMKGHSLAKILERHAIAVDARHRAYDDAKAIFEFTKLAFSEHGQEAFELAVAKQLKTKTLPPNLNESDMEKVTNKPGVYVFEDEAGQPIYVGKSVNLRNRVLSHFTSDTKIAKEMKISQNTHNLRVIETDNELEALLLESQMIKELLPVYNKKLRRTKTQTVFMKDQNEDGYLTITLANKDLSEEDNLSNIYGVYNNRTKARNALESILRSYQLCSKLLSLEKTNGPCFLYQLKKCRGACIGKETKESYNQRVEYALERSKVQSWPYKTPIALQIGEGKAIVIDQWIVLGYLEPVEDAEPYFKKVQRVFDIDTYKILHSFIKKNKSILTIKPFVYG